MMSITVRTISYEAPCHCSHSEINPKPFDLFLGLNGRLELEILGIYHGYFGTRKKSSNETLIGAFFEALEH